MSNVWDGSTDWGRVGAFRLDRPDACALGAWVWELQPGGDWAPPAPRQRGDDRRPARRTPKGERVLLAVTDLPPERREMQTTDGWRAHRVHEFMQT